MHVIPLLSTDIWLLKKILHKGLGKVKFIQDIYLKVHLPHLHIAADWIEFWKVLTILISVTFSLHKQDMKVIYNFLSNFFSRDYKLKEISYKNVFLDDWKKMKSLSFTLISRLSETAIFNFSFGCLFGFTFLAFMSSLLLLIRMPLG